MHNVLCEDLILVNLLGVRNDSKVHDASHRHVRQMHSTLSLFCFTLPSENVAQANSVWYFFLIGDSNQSVLNFLLGTLPTSLGRVYRVQFRNKYKTPPRDLDFSCYC